MDDRTVAIKGKIGSYDIDLTIGEVEPNEDVNTPNDSVETESEGNATEDGTSTDTQPADAPEHEVPGTVSEDA